MLCSGCLTNFTKLLIKTIVHFLISELLVKLKTQE